MRIIVVALLIVCTGCAHRISHHEVTPQAAPLPSPPSVVLAEPCMRPSGVCTRLVHGLNCAVLPADAREVWSGLWKANWILSGDYQTQELRNLVRDGWWFRPPDTLPDGRIAG